MQVIRRYHRPNLQRQRDQLGELSYLRADDIQGHAAALDSCFSIMARGSGVSRCFANFEADPFIKVPFALTAILRRLLPQSSQRYQLELIMNEESPRIGVDAMGDRV